jgi:hypothetical protein
MASGRKPRMSLPPELSHIDEGWGDEEQTTLPRPSRMPTAPVREQLPEGILTAPPTGIELEAIDDDPHERETAPHQIPLEHLARSTTAVERARAATQSPPVDHAAEHDAEFRLDLYVSSFPENEKPTKPHLSQMPTAPPPRGFDPVESKGSHAVALRPPRLFEGIDAHETSGMELDLASELPPPPPPPAQFATPTQPPRSHQLMKDRFAMGDFSGSLDVAEQILNRSPQDPEARSLADKCREVLLDMYSSRISGLEKVPHIAMSADQIRWLSLDHRAGFLLSMIDGISSIDDLLDVSGMQRLDALRILCSLLDQKVIQLT